MYEQKISFKGDGDGMDGNDAKVFASLFHFCYYNPVPLSPYAYLLMPNMWYFSW